ncbi:hypothetical protein [Paremcibacter congregatus]|uniref:hypothetical protein n=1 Tax=Paremcibacter congregatus TaxID=2043170 RepID=UPI0030EDD46A|tara:strand:- start:450 stop:902 length:453 start_codon:yes stop_codon:yes gene_type:complete
MARKSVKHYEDDLTIAVARFLTLSEPGCMWWHTPNGGQRNKLEAGRLQAMGVKPGVADFEFLLPDGTARFVELKLDKTAYHAKTYQSPDQKKFQKDLADLTDCPDHYAVCRSIPEVAKALDGWGVMWMGKVKGGGKLFGQQSAPHRRLNK